MKYCSSTYDLHGNIKHFANFCQKYSALALPFSFICNNIYELSCFVFDNINV